MDIFALCGLLYCIICNRIIKIKPVVYIYIIYIILDTVLVSTILKEVSQTDVTIRMLRVLVLYSFFYIFLPEIFDFDYGFKWYTKVVYLVTVLIVFQYFIYYIFRIDVNILIPGAKINYGSYSTSTELMHSWHDNASIGYYRPCSVFLEPSYQAQYCLPWIAMAFVHKVKGKYSVWFRGIIFVSLGIVLTTSSLGIIGCGLIWVYYAFTIIKKNDNYKISRLLFFIPIVILLIAFIFTQDVIRQQISGKILSLASDKTSSATLRLFRGLACFTQFGFPYSIFGSGYGNIAEFLAEYNIKTVYDKGLIVIDYMNGASTLLCGLGVVGVIFYVLLLFSITKNSQKSYRNILILSLIILMTTSSLFDSAIYFVVATFIQRKENDIELTV